MKALTVTIAVALMTLPRARAVAAGNKKVEVVTTLSVLASVAREIGGHYPDGSYWLELVTLPSEVTA